MNAFSPVVARQAEPGDRPHTVEELLYWLPSALRRDLTTFDRSFVLSVLARSKRRGWAPSDKQLSIMRRIVAEMLKPDADDFDVIDRDG